MFETLSPYNDITLIGICKNAGKTTTLNALVAERRTQGVLAVTSVGRDGEAKDLVTGTAKPEITVFRGMLFATAKNLLPLCDVSKEILDVTDVPTPLGEVVIARCQSDGRVQLAGPSIGKQMTALKNRLHALGATTVIIDGALSRKSFAQRGEKGAAVLCTGASLHRDMTMTVAETTFVHEVLTLPVVERSDEKEYRRVLVFGDGRGADPPNNNDESNKISIENEAENRERPALPPVEEKRKRSEATPVAQTEKSLIVAQAKNKIIRIPQKAVSDGQLKEWLREADLTGTLVVAEDSGKMLMSAATYQKLKARGVVFGVRKSLAVPLVTCCPYAAYGWHYEVNAFKEALAAALPVPVMDVRQGITNQQKCK